MLAALALALALQVPIEQPPRLRTILPNRSVVLVERMPAAPSVVLSLWISAAGSPETPIRHGLRHLYEHLSAEGPRGDLDRRLETAGGFLTASTQRDAALFQVMVPKAELALGFAAVRELLVFTPPTEEAIAKEAAVMAQESAIREPSSLIAAAAWQSAYGDAGLDPFGNLDVMRLATPESLRKVHQDTYLASGIALVVAGDVDLDETTRLAASVLSGLPQGEPAAYIRSKGQPGAGRVPFAAEALAARVGGFREPTTAACLMAGLSLAAEVDGAFFTYTPSNGPGLMTVGRTGSGPVLASALRNPARTDWLGRGRALARRWVSRRLDDPREVGAFRGQLLVQGAGLRPETLLKNLDQVTAAQFAEALGRYGLPLGAEVVGP